ncbi:MULTISPECIES: hypothetical protein [unclassified Janthinobacterium]|uniref:hypothetical protein n=1 Tax=unclassified Janthinobacterium TaxID=2610881 RepID=UPI00034B931E|nr:MULTISPECIES: hypothetical protein [unclassified Janthinobacterium]MEC5161644.1 hypothetical protein [Janthinobacterium sp. CG_S6]
MIQGYILDENKVPLPCADVARWARWMGQEPAAHRVARDETERYLVSTVFLGIDQHRAFGEGEPMLFETTVWFGDGERADSQRYQCWNEAVAGHARVSTTLAMKIASADAAAAAALRAMVGRRCEVNESAETAGVVDAADVGERIDGAERAGAGAAAVDDSVPIWIIYDHPADYPHCFVARKFLYDGASTATETVLTATSLTLIRRNVINAMPHVPNCLERAPGDDAVIVECWV